VITNFHIFFLLYGKKFFFCPWLVFCPKKGYKKTYLRNANRIIKNNRAKLVVKAIILADITVENMMNNSV